MRSKPLTYIPVLNNSKFVTANSDDLNLFGYTDANVKFHRHIDCNLTFLIVPTKVTMQFSVNWDRHCVLVGWGRTWNIVVTLLQLLKLQYRSAVKEDLQDY